MFEAFMEKYKKLLSISNECIKYKLGTNYYQAQLDWDAENNCFGLSVIKKIFLISYLFID